MANPKSDFDSVKDIKFFRNIGIIAHVDAGKTTTTERILFFTKKKHKIGEVHEGAAEMDFMDQEQERGITIQSAATTCFWTLHDQKYRINIIDTPGHVDFTAEVERSLRVLDGAVVVFDGKMGVEPQSAKVWGQADKYNVPRICFINKLNLLGGDFEMSLKSIRDELSDRAVPITYPIGKEHALRGYVDLITMKAYEYSDDTKLEFSEIDIPEDIKGRCEELNQELIDKIADADDELMEKYLEDGVLETEEIYTAIRIHTLSRKIFPVLGGDSRMADTRIILNSVVRYLPSPAQTVQVFEDKDKGELVEHRGKIAGVDPDSGKVIIREFSPKEYFAGLVFKVAVDPHVGTLSFVRIYSGTLEAGSYVYNVNTSKKERIGRILMMHANSREDISKAEAGSIVAVVGLKESYTGHTLCDEKERIALESIDFPEAVVSLAVEAKTQSDQEKMSLTLAKLAKEDPTFNLNTDQETGQTIISGMGELHLEVKVDILKREYGIEVNTGEPQVAYRETIESTIEHREILKKQTGGAGQFADIVMDMGPKERGEGYEFINKVKGGSIPTEYIPSIDKGIQQAMNTGVLGGYPVVDFQITVKDGSYHEVDSNTDTFRICAVRAFKEAMRKAKPILLEPVMKVVVNTPDDYVGDVTGALSSKRGIIKSMTQRGKLQEVVATVPLGNLFGWINDLRSMSKGKASSVMEFDSYQKVPESLLDEVIKK